MSVVSMTFFIFVIISLIVYYITPLRFRWIVLLGASGYFFLKVCSIKQLAVLVTMCLLAYGSAFWIDKINNELKNGVDSVLKKSLESRKKWITRIAVTIEILILIILQDNAFFINNINSVGKLMGSPIGLELPGWAVPLGISYFTLILIGYILDVSWETSKAQKNPVKLLLFTSFFPQMISGPLTRYHDMQNELFNGHRFDHNNIAFGGQRFLWGLFKKLVIAERLSVIVSTIYGDFYTYNGLFVFIGVIGYTLQVYADFSGYMDMIIGVSQMFGIKMPENFNTPFYATNLSEVWRRWHMTLGFWVKDYILYPVLKSSFIQKIAKYSKKHFGKNAGKKIPTYIGMFCTWFFVGFWHGGSWKYILGSGLFFYIMIVGGQILEPVFKKFIQWLRINTECFSWRLFQRLRTFFLFAASVSFGRAASAIQAAKMWKNGITTFNPLIFFDKSLYKLGLSQENLLVLVFSLGVLFVVSLLQQTGSVREKLSKQNLVFRWLVLFTLIFSIIIFGFYGPGYNVSEFIYGGF